MSKRNKSNTPEVLTPETIIRSRIRHLADREEIESFVTKLILMVGMLAVLFGVLFGITPMRNNDMSPRISSGDLMLYYRLEPQFFSGDVVVFRKDGRQYAGRVVAKGGDSVEVTEQEGLRINGSHVVESDIYYPTPRYGDEVAYPVNLEEDEYFILCDFRDGAKDSRYFGAVSRSEIKGKVLAVLRRSGL